MSPHRRRIPMLLAPLVACLLVGLVGLFTGTVSALAATIDRSGTHDQVSTHSTHPDHVGEPVTAGVVADAVVPAVLRSTSVPWTALPLVALLTALLLVSQEHTGARRALRTASRRSTWHADGLRLRAPPTT